MKPVTFSVITPTLDRAEQLAQAIASVNDQSVAPLEHIIVDGGSTDGTHQVLAGFPHLKVISEPDQGLYDAINKGIRIAQGDVLVFLNDDDILLPDALEAALNAFAASPWADTFAGRVVVGPEDPTLAPVVIGSPRLQRMNPRAHTSGTNLFNARFFRRDVFDRVGLFDSRYVASADTEFLGRCFLANVSVVPVASPVYRYVVHAGALTFHGNRLSEELIRERIEIAKDRVDSTDSIRTTRYWRRWLWWWTFYRALRWGSASRWTEFGQLVREDPLGSFDFIAQCFWHAATRRERHGRSITL